MLVGGVVGILVSAVLWTAVAELLLLPETVGILGGMIVGGFGCLGGFEASRYIGGAWT